MIDGADVRARDHVRPRRRRRRARLEADDVLAAVLRETAQPVEEQALAWRQRRRPAQGADGVRASCAGIRVRRLAALRLLPQGPRRVFEDRPVRRSGTGRDPPPRSGRRAVTKIAAGLVRRAPPTRSRRARSRSGRGGSAPVAGVVLVQDHEIGDRAPSCASTRDSGAPARRGLDVSRAGGSGRGRSGGSPETRETPETGLAQPVRAR